MKLQGFSKFLAPILLVVLTVVIAEEGTGRDSNLYQFLDLTRVETSQKNENRHFKWFGKLRRSNKDQKSVEQANSQPEEQYEAAPKPLVQQTGFKIAPFSFHKPGKKSKESSYILLPPLPSINQAKSVASAYVSKQDGGISQPGPPYSQIQSAPTGPAQYSQPNSFSPQEALSYNSPANYPVSPNAESEYHQQEPVSPPAHSDSRYSKWFRKLKRRKSNQHQPQPEKPQHESEQYQDKPPNQGSGVVPESIYYYQNGSPYNNPSQPVATHNNQPGNGQSPTSFRQPQVANSPAQLAPARPANTQPQSAPPIHPGLFGSQINFDSRDNFPNSVTEVLLEQPPPPSGNLYSKLIKKMKRNKNPKPEPVKVVSQAEPIFNPIQTENIPPSSDPALYRPSQSSPQQPPPPRPAAASIVKPQSPGTNLPSDPTLYRRPQSPSGGQGNIVKPQPTASPAPQYSSHHQAPNKPVPNPAAVNSHTKRPPVTVEKPQPHPLFPESETFFSSSPFQKQTEKGQGNHESSDGFFEFGVFPNANDFFGQNFEG